MFSGASDPGGGRGALDCNKVASRIKGDFPNNPNVGPPNASGKCSVGYHKIRPEITPDGDGFHFKRQDPKGKWSEKPNDFDPARSCRPDGPLTKRDKQCPDICVPNGSGYK